MVKINIIKTKIGILRIEKTKGYISSAEFVDNNEKTIITDDDLVIDIKNYFKSASLELFSKIKLIGTPFQIKVWKEIIKIPYGQTKTYSEIAKLIGQPTAYRAVAKIRFAHLAALDRQGDFAIILEIHFCCAKMISE